MGSKSVPVTTSHEPKAPTTTSNAPKAPANTPNLMKFIIGGTAGYVNLILNIVYLFNIILEWPLLYLFIQWM